jgi:hypothetical protein
MTARLTTRQFRSLFVLAYNNFRTTTTRTGWSASGHIGDNAFTTDLFASDVAALTAAGLIRTYDNTLTGHGHITATDTGHALLTRNRARARDCSTLMDDGGLAMHRALRGLPR